MTFACAVVFRIPRIENAIAFNKQSPFFGTGCKDLWNMSNMHSGFYQWIRRDFSRSLHYFLQYSVGSSITPTLRKIGRCSLDTDLLVLVDFSLLKRQNKEVARLIDWVRLAVSLSLLVESRATSSFGELIELPIPKDSFLPCNPSFGVVLNGSTVGILLSDFFSWSSNHKKKLLGGQRWVWGPFSLLQTSHLFFLVGICLYLLNSLAEWMKSTL